MNNLLSEQGRRWGGGGGGGGGGGARGALDTNAADVAVEFSTTNDERTRYHRKKF